MRIAALVLVLLALVAVATGRLDRFLPGNRRNPLSSNSLEKVHSGLRAFLVIVAGCAVVISMVLGLWHKR